MLWAGFGWLATILTGLFAGRKAALTVLTATFIGLALLKFTGALDVVP